MRGRLAAERRGGARRPARTKLAVRLTSTTAHRAIAIRSHVSLTSLRHEPHALVHQRVHLLDEAAPRGVLVDRNDVLIEDDAALHDDDARVFRILSDLQRRVAERPAV